MKKYILSMVILFSVLVLIAYSKINNTEINTGTYVMKLAKEQNYSDKKILPTIFIDTTQKKFTFFMTYFLLTLQ